MALTEIPSELSSTPSIVDNGNSTAITIDSSENVLVGKTTSSAATPGHELKADGAAWHTADGTFPLFLNRETDDGELIRFRKDNTTVGSIGSTAGTHLHAGSGDVGLLFQGTVNAIEPWNPATNGARDNAIDLGLSLNRFKDIYLSGGVNFSANANAGGMTSETLDDYEEGDFNLVVSGGTTAGTNSGGNVGGRYTKIGRLVTCSVVVANTTLSGASGALTLTGFPFTPSNYGNRPPIGVVRMYRQNLAPQSSGYYAPTMEVVHGANYAVFVQTKDDDTWSVVQVDNQSGLYLEGTITYTTV